MDEELNEVMLENVATSDVKTDISTSSISVVGTVNTSGGSSAKSRPSPVSAAETKPKKKIFYSFVKRLFDIVSAGTLFLVLAIPIGICLLVKWLEDVKNPAYRMEIREVAQQELDEKKEKKLPHDWIKRADGKVFECKLVPDKTQKSEEGHNPIYKSTRVGKNGKLYSFYKIRSMCPDADKMKQQLIDAGLNEADSPAFKMENDPRITKVGRFFRKTSIDELLQLINIINGTMSVVGPRPPLPNEVEKYTEEQKRRLDVKGGLLCLWQIQPNRNKLSFDEWVRLDLQYIEKRSVWLDLKIIFKGAWVVIVEHSGQ